MVERNCFFWSDQRCSPSCSLQNFANCSTAVSFPTFQTYIHNQLSLIYTFFKFSLLCLLISPEKWQYIYVPVCCRMTDFLLWGISAPVFSEERMFSTHFIMTFDFCVFLILRLYFVKNNSVFKKKNQHCFSPYFYFVLHVFTHSWAVRVEVSAWDGQTWADFDLETLMPSLSISSMLDMWWVCCCRSTSDLLHVLGDRLMQNKFGVFKDGLPRADRSAVRLWYVWCCHPSIKLSDHLCGRKRLWDSQHATFFHRKANNQQKAQIGFKMLLILSLKV